MAGHKRSVSKLIQSGIGPFIRKSPGNQNNSKRPLTSPESENPPPKRATMPSQEEELKKNNSIAQQLPPDLQLLYDSLSKKIDEKIEPVESKLNSLVGSEFNLPKHIDDVNEIKVQHKNLERKLITVERENVSLKQRLTNLEDKILEHNIVVSGIEEGQWEEDDQRASKVNCELAKLFTVETQDEAVKGINRTGHNEYREAGSLQSCTTQANSSEVRAQERC